jgi:hypothetical protein
MSLYCQCGFSSGQLGHKIESFKVDSFGDFWSQKAGSRLFENDLAFLAAVNFLKMTRLFEKANQLLVMSRGNVKTGLTFSGLSSGVSGSFNLIVVGCTSLSLLIPEGAAGDDEFAYQSSCLD